MSLRNDKCPCGREINEDKYASKGETDYCSDQCADRFGNKGFVQKTYPAKQYSNEQSPVLAPS